jgi:hypothetical protein
LLIVNKNGASGSLVGGRKGFPVNALAVAVLAKVAG